MTKRRRAVRARCVPPPLSRSPARRVPVAARAQEAPWEVVASGLDNPRHLTFAPNGDLFVVEAGLGGGDQLLGASRPRRVLPRVHRCGDGGSPMLGRDPEVLTGLPSIINDEGEVLGPSDIVFTGSKNFAVSVGLGGSDEFRAGFGPFGTLLATLVTGRLGVDDYSLFADVMANEVAANPDGTDIDSNPVGFVRQGSRYVLADAGGNAVVEVTQRRSTEFSTVAALPPTSIGADAVPTAVVRGPDGAYYISQLTGFPFQPGAANIWRVVPGAGPTVFASGLTNVTDLAFARDGTLYAVEIVVPRPAQRSDRLARRRSLPAGASTRPSPAICSPPTAWRWPSTTPTSRRARCAPAEARSSASRSTDSGPLAPAGPGRRLSHAVSVVMVIITDRTPLPLLRPAFAELEGLVRAVARRARSPSRA